MYDYSENNYERKRFILNYEIKDNKIILHFATGNDKEIPYNSINEVKVLKQMEKQISNILDLKDKLSDELDDLKMYKIGSIGKFIISLIGILVSIRIYYSMNVIIYLLGLFGSISLLLGIDIIIKDNKIEKTKKKINELEKFEYFFKERHVINSNIKMNLLILKLIINL